jgi:predicted lipoprotein with Yx(FWY)xxD motif
MRTTAVTALLAALVLVPASAATSRAKVQMRSTSAGKVLVDARGHALYLRKSDASCYGACAATWPPFLTTSKPLAGAGINSKLLGTTKRHDGKLQVTYAGHPLYFFANDLKPGQVNGQGTASAWYLVSPLGKKITVTGAVPPPGYPTSTTGDNGGYGGGYGGGDGYR